MPRLRKPRTSPAFDVVVRHAALFQFGEHRIAALVIESDAGGGGLDACAERLGDLLTDCGSVKVPPMSIPRT